MDWIKIRDGYVRKDAIIDVHINHWAPSEVVFLLCSGDSIVYKGCRSAEEAEAAMNEFVDWMTGKSAHLDELV